MLYPLQNWSLNWSFSINLQNISQLMKRDRSVVRLIVYLYKLISFNLNCLKREFEILMRKNYTLQLFFTYLKLYPIINIACWLFLPLCAIFAPQTGKRLFLGHRRNEWQRGGDGETEIRFFLPHDWRTYVDGITSTIT